MHKILLNSPRFQQCYYFKAGNGPLVMLVHGFGEHSGIFKHQITSLENNFTVLVPDLPGSGLSTLPNEAYEYGVVSRLFI
jgi:pimeloyl-ACP methyl ester carboxylesterase